MGEYLVHARLGCWISRNTLPWHIVTQLVSAQIEALLRLAGMNYVKIRTHCKAENLMAQNGETRNCTLEVELKIDANQTVKEQNCWVLT